MHQIRVLHMVRLARARHHLFDHELGFGGDAVDDMADADGMRDVVNEEEEPGHAGEREEHGAHDRCHRGEGFWQ